MPKVPQGPEANSTGPDSNGGLSSVLYYPVVAIQQRGNEHKRDPMQCKRLTPHEMNMYSDLTRWTGV